MSTPWFKFSPTAWRSEPKLRMCSMAARGLWIEMLCIMHEATPRGDLLVNGLVLTDRQLASLAGISVKELASLVEELESAGVFSRRDNGTIYSRRMEKDTEKAERDKAFGAQGGNPNIKPRVNPPVIATDKAKNLEGRTQEETETKAAQPLITDPHENLERSLREAGDGASPESGDLSPIVALLDKGYDLAKDVLPIVKARCATAKSPIGSWRYFVEAIVEAKAANGAIKPNVVVEARPTVWLTEDDPRWSDAAIRYTEETGQYPLRVGSRGFPGLGWHFPKEWVHEMEATP